MKYELSKKYCTENLIKKIMGPNPIKLEAVSYTHLDVYKRQTLSAVSTAEQLQRYATTKLRRVQWVSMLHFTSFLCL